MEKQVIYNGGKVSHSKSHFCYGDPNLLEIGRIYRVSYETEKEGHIYYGLAGMHHAYGVFDSEWFYEAKSTPVYFAVSNTRPRKGECLKCIRININDECLVDTQECQTSIVRWSFWICESTYEICTDEGIYLVTVKE